MTSPRCGLRITFSVSTPLQNRRFTTCTSRPLDRVNRCLWCLHSHAHGVHPVSVTFGAHATSILIYMAFTPPLFMSASNLTTPLRHSDFLDLPKTIPRSRGICTPSLVQFGPAVQLTRRSIQTDIMATCIYKISFVRRSAVSLHDTDWAK